MSHLDQEALPAAATPQVRPRRRRRWPLMIIILAALIYAAPWLLSIKGVAQSVTAQALPWLPPGSQIGKPSLGWMSPVHLAGLKILDDHGRVLLECAQITSQKTLWEMATSPNSPGGWTLEKPRAFLYVDPTGFSLNPVLQRFLARKRSAQPLAFDVTIDDGRVEFLDPAGKPLAQIESVEATYANAANAKTLQAKGRLIDGERTRPIDLAGSWTIPKEPGALPVAELHGAIEDLPLRVFEPWLKANSTIAEIAGGGRVTLDCAIRPMDAGPSDLQGQLAFAPRDAVYRKANEKRPEPVPASQIQLAGNWDALADLLTLETLKVEAGGISLSGQGTIQQPQAAGIIDLRTVADQDLSAALELLNPDLRRHVVITGLRMRNVAVAGALWPDRFVATASNPTPPAAATLAGDITWTNAIIYGVNAAPGAVTAAFLPDGIALWPRDVRVGEGQLVSLPRIQLVDNRQLVAEQGPMLVDVNMTPEMCREWLKFVSPIVADATAVEGKMTLILEAGQMPFANPNGAEISGIVRIHSAQVTPGPLARQALDAAASVARLVTGKQPAWAESELQIELPPQDIKFRMHQGRVYHQGLSFLAGDLRVITRGSVGLDHTLDMLVEIPIPDAWLDRGPVLKALKGEVVAIPLQGTLERPQVDGRAVAEMGKRIGAGAATGLLQNLLERSLDKAAEKRDRQRQNDIAP